MNTSHITCYRAYLLRIWLERPADLENEAVWRFSLEEIPGESRRGFPSLEALMNYLKTQILYSQDKGDSK